MQTIHKQIIGKNRYNINRFSVKEYFMYKSCFTYSKFTLVIGISMLLLGLTSEIVKSQHTSKDWYTGSWTTPATWDPTWATPITTGIAEDITIYGYISYTGDISFGGSGGDLIINDTLIINGNLSLGNNNNIIINNGGMLIVKGNLSVDNKVDIAANAYIVVTGNFTKIGAEGWGSFTSDDTPSKVFIGGTISVPGDWASTGSTDVLNCSLSTEYTSSGCNYGNSTDLIVDPINDFLQTTCTTFPSVTTNPSNSSICEGNNTSFTITATGGSAYQWQVNTGSGFNNIVNNTVYSNATTITLNITAASVSINGYQYRCVVRTSGGCLTNSNSATLTVNAYPAAPTLSAVTQPTCAVSTGSFTITNYNGSYTYAATPSTGVTITTNTVTAPQGSYTLKATLGSCTSSSSISVTINSQPATPVITVGTLTNPTTCGGNGSIVLNFTNVPNGSYTVSYTSGSFSGVAVSGGTATISAPSGTYNNLQITANTCTSATGVNASLSDPVKPTAPVVGTITQPTCVTATGGVVLSGLPGSGTWTLTRTPGPGTVTGTGTSTTITGLTANTYTYTVTDGITGCVSLSSGNITINSQPSTPVIPILSAVTQPTCAVATGSFTITNYNASYTYAATPSAGVTISGNTVTAPPGSYTITSTLGSCTSMPSASVTLNVNPSTPAAPVVGTITHPTCTVATGNVVLNGLPVGNWTLNPGAITGNSVSTTISLLAAGTYNFTVIDESGCTSAISADITINAQPVTPFISVTDPDAVCSPLTVDLTAPEVTSGSTLGLTLTYWIDAAATSAYSTPSSATSGTYYIKGTNGEGCYDIKPVVVNISPLMSLTNSVTNILCAGTATGTINITVSGGTAPYSYLWTGSGVNISSEDQSGLAAGSYSVVVTDALNCSSSLLNLSLAEPQLLSGKIDSQSDVTVYGGNDGSVTLSGTGGTTPYQYRSGAGAFQSAATFVNLSAGSYIFTVQDINLCSSDISITISQPVSNLTGSIISQTDITCFGASTGIITVAGSGGTAPYEYRLEASAFQGSGTFGSLTAGTYSITVRDATLSTFDMTCTIIQPVSSVSTSASALTNVLCNGGSSGTVTISGNGGTSPYQYRLGSGSFQASGTFTSLAAGNYIFTIQDINLCESNVTIIISEPEIMKVTYTSEDATCRDVADGKAILNISGGTEPYSALWSDGANSVQRSDLLQGTYKVIVTDINGCSVSADVTIGFSNLSTCLAIQEIITPNNDGYYDTWKIRNIDMFPNAEVQVFNRWGKMVFKTKNIPANEWDGTSDGKLLPTDSYHYILYLNDGSDPIRGVITIIR